MAVKKISRILIDARMALGLSAETMAFILDLPEQNYKRYERGQFDKTWSVRKDRIIEKLDTLDLEIEKKILFLKRALRKFSLTQAFTPNSKPHGKKLKVKQL